MVASLLESVGYKNTAASTYILQRIPGLIQVCTSHCEDGHQGWPSTFFVSPSTTIFSNFKKKGMQPMTALSTE